jgi:hypothetical protein
MHTNGVAEPTVDDQALGRMRHPRFVLRDAAADRYASIITSVGADMRRSRELLPRLKARLRHHWKHVHNTGK